MSDSLDRIEKQAQELSADERARLAESMLESLQVHVAEVETAWADEIERRVAAFDRGEIQAYPAEDVFAEVRNMLR